MNEPSSPAPGAPTAPASPAGPRAHVFHAGEIELQRAAGSADRLARVGPQVIRARLPEQHREFFPLLPFVIVGSLDARGQPIASLLSGPPGFVTSPDPSQLRINAPIPRGDPLAQNLAPGAPLAMLGIQPHTRRRNRANGRVAQHDPSGFTLAVEQSFGNCPKYITQRELAYAGSTTAGCIGEPRVTSMLAPEQRALLEQADTFFIASAHPDAARAPAAAHAAAHGLDVSHRGGPPGFVHFIDDATFIIPDLRGNDFYNTLGNLRLQPLAGLLFIDFERGDLVGIEASAEAVVGDHPMAHPAASGRIVRFRVERVRALPGAAGVRVVAAGA